MSSFAGDDNLYYSSGGNKDRELDVAFNFRVMSDEGSIGDFQAVDGLQKQVQVLEYQEGGKNDGPHVLTGPAKWGKVSLRWGLMNWEYLYEWAMEVEVGGDFRRDITVLQLDRQGNPIRTYVISGAWPIEWNGAGLDSSVSQIPIEEVKLVCDSITLEVASE